MRGGERGRVRALRMPSFVPTSQRVAGRVLITLARLCDEHAAACDVRLRAADPQVRRDGLPRAVVQHVPHQGDLALPTLDDNGFVGEGPAALRATFPPRGERTRR